MAPSPPRDPPRRPRAARRTKAPAASSGGGRAPRVRTKQEVVSEFRRGQIHDAARRVFGRRGFVAATIDEVAAEAGIAKGTVYLYARSKKELYRETLQSGIRALHEATSARVAAASGLRARLEAFIETKLAYFDENRDFFRVYHAEVSNLLTSQPHLQPGLHEIVLAQVRQLADALAEAIEDGEARDLPPLAVATAVFDVTRGRVVARLLDSAPAPLEEDVAFLLDLLWAGIGSRATSR